MVISSPPPSSAPSVAGGVAPASQSCVVGGVCVEGGVLRRRRGGRWPDLRGVLTGTGLGHESGGFAPPARAAAGRQDGVRGAGAPRRQGGRRMRPSRGGRESHTGGDFLGCFAMRPSARTQDRLALIFSRMQRYVTGTS